MFKETASWGTPSGVTSTRHLPVSTFPSKSMPITRRNKNNCHVWDIPLMKPMKCHHVYPISPLFKPQKQGWNCSFLESNLLFFDVLNLQKREMFHVLNLKKWRSNFPKRWRLRFFQQTSAPGGFQGEVPWPQWRGAAILGDQGSNQLPVGLFNGNLMGIIKVISNG